MGVIYRTAYWITMFKFNKSLNSLIIDYMYTLLGQNLLLCLDAEFWNSMAQENLRRVLQKQWNTNIAKNVILFLGDGMGISTVTAARIYKGQQQNKTGEEAKLAFEEFPEIGLVKVE